MSTDTSFRRIQIQRVLISMSVLRIPVTPELDVLIMTEDTIVRNIAEVNERFASFFFWKIIFNNKKACPAGMTGNGKYCETTDHCKIANGGCSTTPMVKCSNTASGPKCGACPSGFNKISI